jgi:hypothetical protein
MLRIFINPFLLIETDRHVVLESFFFLSVLRSDCRISGFHIPSEEYLGGLCVPSQRVR